MEALETSRGKFFIFTALTLLLVYFTVLKSQYMNNHLRIAFTQESAKCLDRETLKDDRLIVLFWTNFMNHEPLIPETPLPCSTKCFFFHRERSLLPLSDAVIFHSNDILYNSTDMPTNRSSDQIWIFMELESPVRFDRPDLKRGNYNSFFNWTMTYRRDSDVQFPYIKTTKVSHSTPLNRTQLNNKTQLAAWVVSHCPTPSKREEYAKELQKYMPVDIYGGCGNLTCPTNRSECIAMIGQKYKFFLSFENAICHDYITEKFSHALENNLVPVVMGGGDYKSVAPPKSYIHVDDFESPKALAEYLLFLNNHTDKYLEYFQWKENFEVHEVKLTSEDGWCTLCKQLEVHKRNPKKKIYLNLWKWWSNRNWRNEYEERTGANITLEPACIPPRNFTERQRNDNSKKS